jgi:hypothetical protein
MPIRPTSVALEPELHRKLAEHGIGDFDLAYAYEAMARAHALAGEAEQAARYEAQARRAGERIAEEDDRELFANDLATLRSSGT